MMWDHTAYCRKCRKRVYVQPRYNSRADDVLLTLVTLGLYVLLKWTHPRRFGRWQCDICGSKKCVAPRKVEEDANGHHRRKRKHKRKHRHSQ